MFVICLLKWINVLKTQLHSKIFQIDPAWREKEDILTGDFFGILDYLPRDIYLQEFILYVVALNPNVQTPCCDGVDWDETEIQFWPHVYGDEENAEPDIVIISNKWVLVLEIKLQSGLGDAQPWREYLIGRKIAEDKGLSSDSVYYLLVAQEHLDISQTFKSTQNKQCKELCARSAYLKWHEAVSLIDLWLRKGVSGERIVASNHHRMLSDLFRALKRRRAITFSGFSFENIGFVGKTLNSFFCPPRFIGYLQNIPQTEPTHDSIFFKQKFKGFGSYVQKKCSTYSFIFFNKMFKGFAQKDTDIKPASNSLFFLPTITFFQNIKSCCTKEDYVFFKEFNT